ncbi:L-seryl-tRNA(Sec) selenium transferase [Aquibacillus sediminis]|uniref:L-seryl-tRNA(Sec) selenium transferase n=1 Tax=Aquibacillus sediminis TaxID=2574734 RepID=UPI0011099BAE|nr:L-seryl-tRNA(Sec) selenium transferase [Aquibacillus sediminis]
MNQWLRQLPPVHEFQKSEQFKRLVKNFQIDPSQVTKQIQQEIAQLRSMLLKGCYSPKELSKNESLFDYIWTQVEQKVTAIKQDHLIPVINATGTVLHTNLGRARLSEDAIQHMVEVARNYSNLEYKISQGERGSRHEVIEQQLINVTGAEAAMVVNNNAAAVFLTLRALAKHKQVIVSRGQLVEIGGSFRISSIMEESDAELVEVGTTNKTHLYDYQQAITDDTSMILKVHTSNFKTIGFTETVASEELVTLKQDKEQLIVYEDLGSGSLYDFHQQGVGDEPVVRDLIAAGVDLVSFSGDKLLGGPQAGIIVGKKKYIDQLKKHQLARVLRVDKLTLAGLEKTLQAYLSNQETIKQIPTVRDILKTKQEILQQVNSFVNSFERSTVPFQLEVIEQQSQIGGGTMPAVELPTYVVALSHHYDSAEIVATKLRTNQPAVISRVKDNRVLLDFRTIDQQEMKEVAEAFKRI